MKTLTLQRLKEVLFYDPATGVFTWSARTANNHQNIGDRAGTASGLSGYRRIKVDGKNYMEHRLAVFWMTGSQLSGDVDHINRDRADNRWINLRQASRAENLWNVGLRKNNTSGYIGVTFDKRVNMWKAQIRMNGRATTLGYFHDIGHAAAAYDRAAAQRRSFASLNEDCY